eukprot:scaffold7861_cov84-Isochrysis_galbana.AAC.1
MGTGGCGAARVLFSVFFNPSSGWEGRAHGGEGEGGDDEAVVRVSRARRVVGVPVVAWYRPVLEPTRPERRIRRE